MQNEPLRGQQDLRIAIVVDPELPVGLLANTIGAIAIGLGGRHPELSGVRLKDANGVEISASADRPVPILQADRVAMQALLAKADARGEELATVAFPAFARSLHAFADYEETFPTRTLGSEKIDGIGLVGPAAIIRSLTGSLKLLR